MKAITACPHCNTQFYVDDEQLAQYNGKVRCGSCLKVFAAADYFIDDQTSEPTQEETAETNEAADAAEEELAQVEEAASNVLAFNRDASTSMESLEQETAVAPEAAHEELGDSVDENFIAKTESLIKNIDIEDVASKLDASIADVEPTPAEVSAATTDTSVATTSLVDDLTSTTADEPNFSFKIDTPDTLDELSKWREEADKPIDEIKPLADSDLDVLTGADVKESVSIDAEPQPMADDFVMPAPKPPAEDGTVQDDAQADENYDFLLNEKEKPSPLKIAIVILLALLLLGQVVYYFRNTIAREMPATKPLLEQFCLPLGCTISLPQEINLLSIDDSGIEQDPKLKGVIRLTSTITNRANFNQEYPKLEVTLTDERDQPQVRRIFKPVEYLQQKVNLEQGIDSGESVPVEMSLMTDNVSVSGFRILLTY